MHYNGNLQNRTEISEIMVSTGGSINTLFVAINVLHVYAYIAVSTGLIQCGAAYDHLHM